MMRLINTAFFICLYTFLHGQHLKSVVYDFDGLDINQTDLPEGDYGVNDLTYQIAANPLSSNDMMGDRVLKLNLNWSTNYGAFGRGISRYVEFNPASDRINFFFYNPVANNQNAVIDVVLGDDDNQNLFYDYDNDDTWKKSLNISGNPGWQFFSIPLSEFTDINPGGNGIFDVAFTQNKGMLLFTEFRFFRSGSSGNASFYLDYISFSEGELPKGNTVFDLPQKQTTDYALLGAFKYEPTGMEYQIPTNFEALFPAAPGKKLKYANWFLHWSSDGSTVPKNLPGNEVQILLNNGYTPIITWEPMFAGLDRLHPSQPRLNNIIGTQYDSYIDQFAAKIKSYNDTVIIRFMHEFEGDWYSWSLTHNGEDPQLYVNAFRKVVDRFRSAGATKVKWMWCVNSDYYPYKHYNWIVPAYPGDNYVDIIATDIYNNHWPPQLPWWRSFRWQTTESYYYLTKYFPNKPLYICEVGCRERFNSENSASETKGQWYARMDKELQSNFRLIRALIFFHANPDQNWLVNSSASALQSLTDNVWNDTYYFKQSGDSVPPPPPSATCSATGNILREVWTNISGTSVSNIPLSSAPSLTAYITTFSTPASYSDNYGQRLRGFICAPVTGNYTFWIASDDNSELWLSTNDSPTGKIKIASVAGWTNKNEWTKYTTQQSAPVSLAAGQRYYIEALHKEGSQGDHLSVGWQLPSGSYERPIPGSRLSPAVSTSSVTEPTATLTCKASIQPGGATTFCTGGNVTLFANAGEGISYQWIRNNTSITGATSHSYNTSTAGDYQVKISFPGCTSWSAPVKVDVGQKPKARITAGGPTTFCNGGSVTLYATSCPGYIYQWKKNSVDIPGANASTYTATTSGSYQVKIVQGGSANWSALTSVTVNNCGSSSRINSEENTAIPSGQTEEVFKLNVYPNPTTGMFTIDFCLEDVEETTMEIKILNATTGTIVFHREPVRVFGCVNESIELSGTLATGLYLLQLKIGEHTESAKMILNR